MKNLFIGKDPDAGKEGIRRRGLQDMRWLHSITNSMDMSLSKLREIVKDREACRPWCCKELDSAERLNKSGKGRDAETREEQGTAEDEMVVWHHQLNGHEFESTPGVGDGQ